MTQESHIAILPEKKLASAGTNFLAIPLHSGKYLKAIWCANKTHYRDIYVYAVNAHTNERGSVSGAEPDINVPLRDRGPPHRANRIVFWRGNFEVPAGDWYLEAEYFNCSANDELVLFIMVSDNPESFTSDTNETKMVMPIIPGYDGMQRQTDTLVNNVTLTKTVYTCPAGCEAIIMILGIYNADSVDRVCQVIIRDSSNNIRFWLFDGTIAATAWGTVPQSTVGIRNVPFSKIPLTPGDYVQVVLVAGGASAGGTAIYDGDIREYPGG